MKENVQTYLDAIEYAREEIARQNEVIKDNIKWIEEELGLTNEKDLIDLQKAEERDGNFKN